MKTLLKELFEKYERDICWALFAAIGWGLAFWYMPHGLRDESILAVMGFTVQVALAFLTGLLLRSMRVLWIAWLGVPIMILSPETLHAINEHDSTRILELLTLVIGLSLASRIPGWSAIKAFFAQRKNAKSIAAE